MFDKNYAQIKTLYKDLITEVWEESFTIIMTDTDTSVGLVECSDIILVFTPKGDLVLMTERVYKRNYKWFRWLSVRKSIRKERNKFTSDTTLFTTINYGNNFVDLTLYKKWWHEWARELV